MIWRSTKPDSRVSSIWIYSMYLSHHILKKFQSSLIFSQRTIYSLFKKRYTLNALLFSNCTVTYRCRIGTCLTGLACASNAVRSLSSQGEAWERGDKYLVPNGIGTLRLGFLQIVDNDVDKEFARLMLP